LRQKPETPVEVKGISGVGDFIHHLRKKRYSFDIFCSFSPELGERNGSEGDFPTVS
jgi:hypothetical protein